MKRMAALFAVMGAMTAVVPATTSAATLEDSCSINLIAVRIC